MKKLLDAFCVALALALAGCAPLPAQSSSKAELLWLGQSAFRLTTPGGKVIVIDPWLRTNPATPVEYKNLEKLGHVDLILVTHGHFDHIADAPALAQLNKARVYAPGDLNQTLTVLGVLPAAQLPRMNKGGTVAPFPDVPGIRITEVRAEHSSLYVWKNPATSKDEVHVGGEPIGGNFTMDPKDAAFATREWIKPKMGDRHALRHQSAGSRDLAAVSGGPGEFADESDSAQAG